MRFESGALNQRAIDTMVIRMYNVANLEALTKSSGLKISSATSFFFKPLPESMMKDMSDELLDGFMQMGFQFREFGREVCVVATATQPG